MKRFKYCVMCGQPHEWTESDLTYGNDHKQQLMFVVCNDCKDQLSKPTSTNAYFYLQKAIRIVEGK